jgi:secreted trypsin-like serine protease
MILCLFFLCLLNFSASHDCGIATATNSLHFPWIAEIFSTINKTETGSDKRLCGSTIITSSFAITASHCFQEKGSDYKRPHDEVYLLANITDLKHTRDSFRINLKAVITHPNWNTKESKYEGDIALLEFKDALPFTEEIKPICMWHDGIEQAARGKVISFISLEKNDPGYYNHHQDESHNYAQLFDMPIRTQCTKAQPRFLEIATDSTYCAGGLNSGACLEPGNSGSGMGVEIDGKYYMRGIVSASFIDIAGCDNYTFTLFTDVLKHRHWIEGIVAVTNLTLS